MSEPLESAGGPYSTFQERPVASNASLREVVARALSAYEALADLGETVEGEWQYVTDLRSVYGADLRGLAAATPERSVGEAVVAAVDAAVDEIALITDPHRAIDWLSTFPQIVRLALATDAAPG